MSKLHLKWICKRRSNLWLEGTSLRQGYRLHGKKGCYAIDSIIEAELE